jgi:hypothetical protein
MKLERNILVSSLVVVALLVVGAAHPAAAAPRASVSISFFYDALAPHGDWILSAQFGHVWRPGRVAAGWRPYTDGRWVYSDFGWMFVSNAPWGWATFHYGRWYLDPYYGWLWVPGYEWAPAWVVFHQGSGWIGWAPLPPRVSLSVVVGGRHRIDPRYYYFVEERHFTDRRIRSRIVPVERNVRLVHSVPNVTRFSRSGDRYLNRSLANDRIERASRSRVMQHRVVDAPRFDERSRTRVERREVVLYRPQVSARATHPPQRVIRPENRRGERVETRGPDRTPRAQAAPERGRSSDKPAKPEKKRKGRDRKPPPRPGM